jgi:hypothetical protein
MRTKPPLAVTHACLSRMPQLRQNTGIARIETRDETRHHEPESGALGRKRRAARTR